MRQTWHDLLFAHWPLPVEGLRPLVPTSLAIDTFDGAAWVGVVPFRMSGIRLRGLPRLPGLSALLELNVRTYVSVEGKPGVWFLSLDAQNPLVVLVARRWFRLPYFHAHMALGHAGERIVYASRRVHRGAPPAEFAAAYRPVGDPAPGQPGTIEHFLTERYCLYRQGAGGGLFRGEIHHVPWPLQPAETEIARNTMTHPLGLKLPDTRPLLHFARRLDALIWRPVPLGRRA